LFFDEFKILENDLFDLSLIAFVHIKTKRFGDVKIL